MRLFALHVPFPLVCLAMLLGGCDNEMESADVNAHLTGIAEVGCQQLFDCCDEAELADQLMFISPTPTTAQECALTFGAFAALGGHQQAVDAGRLVFDADQSRACLDALAAYSCAQYANDDGLEMASACASVFEGQVADGEACELDEECISGLCLTDLGSDAGACAPIAGLGEPCEFDQCAPGLRCAAGSEECEALAEDGAECFFDSECASDSCNGLDGTGSTGTCGPASENGVCDGS